MKSILLFNGKYEVFEDGSVVSHTKVSNGAFLKLKLSMHGYLKVPIYFNKKTYLKSVHRLVALAFIPNPSNKPCVNHINGLKIDNRVENLEWVTHSENTKHGYRIGTNKFSQEQKESYSKRMSGKTGTQAHASKKVSDGITTYASLKEASIALNIKYTTLSAMLIGQNKNKTNFKFI